MAAIDTLNAEVARTNTLAGQIVTLLQSQPANQDPAIQAAADSLKTANDTLEAAIPKP